MNAHAGRSGRTANDPHLVYVARDADGTPLYVGVSVNVRNRMAWHKIMSPWFSRMASLTTNAYPGWEVGHLAEKVSIRTLNPECNGERYPHLFTPKLAEQSHAAASEANRAGAVGCSLPAPLAVAS